MMISSVQTVQVVQDVQTPSFIPRVAGDETRRRLERSAAVEPSEAIERIERYFRQNTPTLQYSIGVESFPVRVFLDDLQVRQPNDFVRTYCSLLDDASRK